jgi:transcription elongation factor Elf1
MHPVWLHILRVLAMRYHCPRCGSETIGSVYVNDVRDAILCFDCEHLWYEWFK